MSPDDIIVYVLELYDLLKLQTSGNSVKNAAFQAGSSSTGLKKHKSVKDIECYICSKKGHIKADCWVKGSGKEGQSPHAKKNKLKSNSVNVAAKTPKKMEDGVWVATALDLFEDNVE